jgi:hypothetical protein
MRHERDNDKLTPEQFRATVKPKNHNAAAPVVGRIDTTHRRTTHGMQEIATT